ncbi:MAG: glycosyltransferase [Gemmatimonadota bacterium]|nr:glycosyltransferase [Gemmatimonadota bacterium]
MATRERPSATPMRPGADAEISVIVTVVERPEPLETLYREYAAVLDSCGRSYEFIFVLHPYFREMLEPLLALQRQGAPVRTIESPRSIGETALLRLGLADARGTLVITLPAYRQVLPQAVCELVAAVDSGADLAVARRWPRLDSKVNRLQHLALHLTAGRLANGTLHDIACGVRAARRDVLRDIPLYGDFARFLPLLAIYNGYNVVEVASPQHPSDLPRRVYGPGVYVRRLIDILGLYFLLRFTEKPLRFFGLIGAVLSGIGGIALVVMFVQRLLGQPLGNRPLMLLAVLLATLGVQAIALGLVGEMIVHFNASRRRSYRLREPRASADESARGR